MLQNRYNVSNNNFYSVKISGVAMKSLYSNAVIAQSSAYKKHPLEISARSEDELLVPMDFILSGEHGSLVWVTFILLLSLETMQSSYCE